MSRNEAMPPDYSAYIAKMSNHSQLLSLFSGFTFTAITILISLLPDPTEILSQVILFVLTFLYGLFITQLYFLQELLSRCVRIAPVLPERTRKWAGELLYWSLYLLGLPLVLMFLLWKLIYLALATAITYGFFIILAWVVIKPLVDLMKEEGYPIRK